MGNDVSAAKGALAMSGAKSQAKSVLGNLTGEDKKKKKKIIENPETKREMNARHKQREMDYKKQKEERRQKISDLQGKWDAQQSKRNAPGIGVAPQTNKGSWWGKSNAIVVKFCSFVKYYSMLLKEYRERFP
eukprot:1037986_1